MLIQALVLVLIQALALVVIQALALVLIRPQVYHRCLRDDDCRRGRRVKRVKGVIPGCRVSVAPREEQKEVLLCREVKQ